MEYHPKLKNKITHQLARQDGLGFNELCELLKKDGAEATIKNELSILEHKKIVYRKLKDGTILKEDEKPPQGKQVKIYLNPGYAYVYSSGYDRYFIQCSLAELADLMKVYLSFLRNDQRDIIAKARFLNYLLAASTTKALYRNTDALLVTILELKKHKIIVDPEQEIAALVEVETILYVLFGQLRAGLERQFFGMINDNNEIDPTQALDVIKTDYPEMKEEIDNFLKENIPKAEKMANKELKDLNLFSDSLIDALDNTEKLNVLVDSFILSGYDMKILFKVSY